MNRFEYDITTLIECVEERPCLWDQFREEYKDTLLKKKAWREVFEHLQEDYNQLDWSSQKKIGDAIKSKWQNIRDAFVRSLRREGDSGFHRKYIYYDDLHFLLKVLQKDDYLTNMVNMEDAEIKVECDPISLDAPSTSKEVSCQNPITWSNTKRRRLEFLELETSQKPKTESSTLDEDEAFFLSLLPSVKKMSDDEKLDFRMGVLQVIQKVRQKRNGIASEYKKSPKNS
ncbi:uncharacterized protein LOC123316933 [Coccinella septempunctata]|uniref:uncharacterized protein LOC123316933 n=1 Tax=Coccinella septempunctata TaxID=41139 RepID=UPI001D083417|nr:uncharacterized protein LOC123316933 [Coccinella septempunctata]